MPDQATSLPPAPPPLPRRIAWFAPWTWPTWKRWALLALLPVCYIEFPVPIAALNRRTNGTLIPPELTAVLEVAWAPLNWAYLNVPIVEQFYDLQFDAINSLMDFITGQ